MAILKGTREFTKMPTVNGNDIVPSGGTTDQVLTKNSATEGDYSWQDATGGMFEDHEKTYLADSWDLPINADWAVSAFAPAARDSNNAAILVRRFDDTVEEGVGTALKIPPGATNMTWQVMSRAQSAPVSAQDVITKFYFREVPDNAAIPGTWTSGGTQTISIPTNTFWQRDTFSGTLAAFGLTADTFYTFEYTRDAGNAGDTLTGDWCLLAIILEFT